jgi:peptidoglycan/xylan/chitin deacetylase (PgdA/CDA1 family)
MELGNHGMQHRPWAGLDDRQLQEELIEARGRLQELSGQRIVDASCPFGSYDRRVIQCLRSAGYRRVYTSDSGPAAPASWLLPRSSVYQTDSLEDVRRKLSNDLSVAHRIWRRAKLFYKQRR